MVRTWKIDGIGRTGPSTSEPELLEGEIVILFMYSQLQNVGPLNTPSPSPLSCFPPSETKRHFASYKAPFCRLSCPPSTLCSMSSRRFLTCASAVIHSLPTELLSYILELSSSDHSSLDNDRTEPEPYLLPFGTETIKPPVVFSSVCKQWRAVAHGTASIVRLFPLHPKFPVLRPTSSVVKALHHCRTARPWRSNFGSITSHRLYCCLFEALTDKTSRHCH